MRHQHRGHRRPLRQLVGIVITIVAFSVPVWTGACSGRKQPRVTLDSATRVSDRTDGAPPTPRKPPPRKSTPTKPALRWRYDTVFPITVPPVVSGRKVVIGSTDGAVRALKRTSGERVWRAGLDSPVEGVSVASGGALLVSLRDGRLVRLSPDSGAVDWTAHTGARIRHAPAVGGGVVVVGNERGHVVAVDQRSGAEVWRHKTGRLRIRSVKGGYDAVGISGAPVVDRGVVFVASLDRHVQALERVTGGLLWRTGTLNSQATPAVVSRVSKHHVLLSGADGIVYALHRKTGQLQWRVALPSSQSPIARAIALAVLLHSTPGNDTLYVPLGAGKLHAIALPSGRRLWSLDVGHHPLTSPTPAPEGLYLASHDGTLYALGSKPP